MNDATLTVWVVCCWLAGTWNGLAWGTWTHTTPTDYLETP
jgi:hypothetical protein